MEKIYNKYTCIINMPPFEKGKSYKVHSVGSFIALELDFFQKHWVTDKNLSIYFEPYLTLSEKRLKFLEDGIEYYKTHPRGINNNGTCSYQACCMIGRKVHRLSIRKLLDRQPEDGSITHVETFNLLPDYLKELGQEFLILCQQLHDTNIFWNEGSLTNKGNEKVERIITYISKNAGEAL